MMPRPKVVRRELAPLDDAERRRHKLRNVAHSTLLLGGIVSLLALCGWVLFGGDGLVGMGLGAGIAFAFSPKVSDTGPLLPGRLAGARLSAASSASGTDSTSGRSG
jgi:hypothetical protein